jgi:hypothetical protein
MSGRLTNSSFDRERLSYKSVKDKGQILVAHEVLIRPERLAEGRRAHLVPGGMLLRLRRSVLWSLLLLSVTASHAWGITFDAGSLLQSTTITSNGDLIGPAPGTGAA